MNERTRPVLLALVVIAIIAGIAYLDSHSGRAPLPQGAVAHDVTVPADSGAAAARRAAETAKYPLAKELLAPDGYINTPGPITLSQYVGKKVILLDIWTYSCINCQRTVPYLNDWYSKYESQGLVIIGLHVPEFDFEKDAGNVRAAVQQLGIKYPVVLDSNHYTADGYGMQFWPEEYLINIDGYVVDTHIGEGDYAAREQEIVSLLNERKQALGEPGTVTLGGQTASTTGAANAFASAVDLSPETYFGAYRNQSFGNGTPGATGVREFALPAKAPASLAANEFYLSGWWDVEQQYIESASPDAAVSYVYEASNVFLVAGSGLPGAAPVKAEVTLDGKPLGALAGADVTEATGPDGALHSYVTIGINRLYRIVKDTGPDNTASSLHLLRIAAQGKGLQAYTFTFGADM